MNLNIIIYNLYIVLMDTQLKNNILPKNFDSNKLINPDIVLEDEEEEDEIDETIDEMDDETLEIINRMRSKKINSDQSTFFEDKPKNIKSDKVEKSSKKEKKKLSLQELNKVIEEDTKPTIKRFTSKRVEDKKSHNDPIFPKRQFNPKKPPYNFIRKVSTTIIPNYNNNQEFPEL